MKPLQRKGRTARKGHAAAAAAVLLPAGIAAMALLAGCSQPQQSPEDLRLLQLAGLLQGRYDNAAQVEADRSAGRTPHPAVNVAIVQIDSLTVSEHAFYLQVTDAADPQHILEQRVFSLQADKGGIVQTLWSLAEPARWRAGASQPELFSALQYPDIKLLTGCSLLWKKAGDKFTGVNDMTHCHATPPEAHGAVFARWEMEVASDTLGLSERAYDADSKLVSGREDEPFLRLRRVVN